MRKRIKAGIILLGAAVLVFAFNSLYVANHNPMLVSNTKDVDTTQVSPQKLVDKSWHIIKNEYYDGTFNNQSWSRSKYRYSGKIKTPDDAKVVIEIMLASLNDPYSRFLTKEEFEQQNTSIVSKIYGIGVNIINNSGKIQITNVINETPAQFADLKSGDIILSINGQTVSGLSLAEVSKLVKGPANTFVDMELLRGTEKISKKIIRKEIKIKTIKSSNIDDIGYIQISSFISQSTPSEFIQALEDTDKTKGLIIDLRGNAGGLLANAVFIANIFITKGKIVSIVGRNGFRYDVEAQNSDVKINKPIVILVDNNSASASEILSGAMKDYHKAIIVGTKTYGKGMVQKIIPMPNSTGLNLTIAKYLTPNGSDINKKGITPDKQVEFSIQDIENQNDAQLKQACLILNNMIAQSPM